MGEWQQSQNLVNVPLWSRMNQSLKEAILLKEREQMPQIVCMQNWEDLVTQLIYDMKDREALMNGSSGIGGRIKQGSINQRTKYAKQNKLCD